MKLWCKKLNLIWWGLNLGPNWLKSSTLTTTLTNTNTPVTDMEMFTPGKIPRSEPGTLHSLNLDNNQVEPGTIPRLNRGNIPAMENKAGKIPSYSWEKPCFSRDLRWLYISLL